MSLPVQRMPGPSRRAWEDQKATIEDLYIRKNTTLKDVMKTMTEKGFNASEQQYKIKFNEWGFSKYKRRGRESMEGRAHRNGANVDAPGAAPYDPEPSQPLLMPSVGFGGSSDDVASGQWNADFLYDGMSFGLENPVGDIDDSVNLRYNPYPFQPFNLGNPASKKLRAAQGGHIDIVKKLLAHQSVADPVDKDNVTPLWSAAQQGYNEIVQILLDAGADKEMTSTDGERRPIHQAAQNGHLEVVKTLLDAGAKAEPNKDSYDDETPSPLWLAAQQGHCDIAKLLIRKKVDVNFAVHPSKRTPLHQAAQSEHIDMVNILIHNGANVNAQEEDNWPVIMIAAQRNCPEIVDMLLQNHADVNAEEKDGATALWIASQQGHTQIVKMLLDHGAKSFATRASKRLPIHQAAQNGHLEVVKLLLEQNPLDVHKEEKEGVTPLFLASQGDTPGHLDVARYLLDHGANPTI